MQQQALVPTLHGTPFRWRPSGLPIATTTSSHPLQLSQQQYHHQPEQHYQQQPEQHQPEQQHQQLQQHQKQRDQQPAPTQGSQLFEDEGTTERAPKRRKTIKKKSPSFTESETVALLEVWASAEIYNQLRRHGMKKPIWEKVAREMGKLGFKRTGEQYKEKVKSLERKYKDIKEKLNHTGEGNDTEFPYFDIIDSVMGTNPTVSPQFLVDSGGAEDDDDDDINHKDDISCTSVQSSAGSSTTEEALPTDDSSKRVAVRKSKSDKDKRVKSPRSRDFSAEEIVTTMDKRLSSMEDKFIAVMEKQMDKEERLFERRLQADEDLNTKQQHFFLEALKILREQ